MLRRLSEPLKKAREDAESLRRQLGARDKEKNALAAARAKLKNKEEEVKTMSWELEVLQQKYDRVMGKCEYLEL